MTVLSSDDIVQIDQLISRYAFAIDDGDWDAVRSCCTPDVEMDFSDMGGGAAESVEVLIELGKKLRSELGAVSVQHFLPNRLIEADGDGARARVAVLGGNRMRGADGGESLLLAGGAYRMRCRRTASGWLLSYVKEELTWIKVLDTTSLDEALPGLMH